MAISQVKKQTVVVEMEIGNPTYIFTSIQKSDKNVAESGCSVCGCTGFVLS